MNNKLIRQLADFLVGPENNTGVEKNYWLIARGTKNAPNAISGASLNVSGTTANLCGQLAIMQNAPLLFSNEQPKVKTNEGETYLRYWATAQLDIPDDFMGYYLSYNEWPDWAHQRWDRDGYADALAGVLRHSA